MDEFEFRKEKFQERVLSPPKGFGYKHESSF